MLIRQQSEAAIQRPYALVGAGQLTASIWKLPEAPCDSPYVFNIFRLLRHSGQVSQQFVASDVASLVKLAHVLAATLLDDGCLPESTRQELRQLVETLEALLPSQDSELEFNLRTEGTAESTTV